MKNPIRVQRKRTKGWKMPNNTIYVGRPTKWGNPFKVREVVDKESPLFPYIEIPGGARGFQNIKIYNKQAVVNSYDAWLCEQPSLMFSTKELKGKNLACFCPLDEPCHADVLLEVANY